MARSSVDQCTNCGLCNTVDPILGVVRKETAGTRFKAVLAKDGKPSTAFYLATDTTAQEAVCPATIDLGEAFRLARERSVKAGVTTTANERMRQNFLRNGTPYENLSSEEYTDKPFW
jgi:Fe-S oxidoreductase